MAAESHEATVADGPGCNTIKMYVSFISLPDSSLCHYSGRPDSRGEQGYFSDSSSDRRTPGWGVEDSSPHGTIRYSWFHIFCMRKSPVYFSAEREQSQGTWQKGRNLKMLEAGEKGNGKDRHKFCKFLNKAPINHPILFLCPCASRPHSKCFEKILVWCQHFGTGEWFKGAWRACRTPEPDCSSLPSECVQTNKVPWPFFN